MSLPSTPVRIDSSSTPRRPLTLTVVLVAVLCLLAIANVYYGRLRAPSDLYRKDQNKTMSYTLDIVLNGRFSLPRDVLFQPATKPPLYNWLAALVVGPTGIYDEWAQKWPSVAASFAIAVMVGLWCWRRFSDSLGSAHAAMVGLLASAIWMASKSTVLLLYIARPDMVQALCLIGAWMTGTAALGRTSRSSANGPAFLFWLATTAAALAKGPAAVYPILYVILASKLCFGRWGRLRNLRFIPGLSALFGSTAVWLLFAYRQDAEHVRDVLIGTEVVKRIAASNPEGFVKPIYFSAMWFVTQNPYWSAGAIGVVICGAVVAWMQTVAAQRSRTPLTREVVDRRPALGTFVDYQSADFLPANDDGPATMIWRVVRRFFAGPMGAPTLWLIVVVGCLSIPKDKRMDFLLPSHPAVAILAAYGIVAALVHTRWARYALPFAAVAFVIWQGRPMKIEAIGDAIDAWMRPALVTPIAWALKILAGALLAGVLAGAFYLSRRWIRLEYILLAIGVLYWSDAMVQGVYKVTRLPGRTNASVHAARFAQSARALVGDAKVVSIIRSKHPILTIMGRHQGSYLTRADFEQANYVIAEVSKFPKLKPLIVTRGSVPVDYGDIVDTEKPISEDTVGLFKVDRTAGRPSVDELVSIHRWVAAWTSHDANPYRSKNTVWIDEPGQPAVWSPPPGDPWIQRNAAAATRPVRLNATNRSAEPE